MSNTEGAICGAGITYTSGAPGVNPDFLQVQSLSTIVVVSGLFSTTGTIQYVKGTIIYLTSINHQQKNYKILFLSTIFFKMCVNNDIYEQLISK